LKRVWRPNTQLSLPVVTPNSAIAGPQCGRGPRGAGTLGAPRHLRQGRRTQALVDEGAEGAGAEGLAGVLAVDGAVGEAGTGEDAAPESPDEESLLDGAVLPADPVDALEDEPRLSFL